MKKIFENAVWWSGVIMVGLVLGLSLQFVRAWTEPTEAPPGGNVGAPINTGGNFQWKGLLGDIGVGLGINGVLDTIGLKVRNTTNADGKINPGDVLVAQKDPLNPAISNGQAAWAPGGEASFTFHCFSKEKSDQGYGEPTCENKGGVQGFCPDGYKQRIDLGTWGYGYYASGIYFYCPPMLNCHYGSPSPGYTGPGTGGNYVKGVFILGNAYVCSK